jgi:hypothetical protein
MWKITKDFIENGKSVGVRSVDCEDSVLLPFRFRMIDADRVVYYEGCSDDSDSFDPLDDFGTGYAGATSIEYFRNSAFAQL